jgi:hypothetical protein
MLKRVKIFGSFSFALFAIASDVSKPNITTMKNIFFISTPNCSKSGAKAALSLFSFAHY